MDRECMNVVYASNDGYARHLGTSLVFPAGPRTGILRRLAVYVLTLGLSEGKSGESFGKSQSILGEGCSF